MAPTVEAAIHELMDLARNVVYDLLEERGLLGDGLFVEEFTGIHSGWTGPPGPPSSTRGRSRCCSSTPGRSTPSPSTTIYRAPTTRPASSRCRSKSRKG